MNLQKITIEIKDLENPDAPVRVISCIFRGSKILLSSAEDGIHSLAGKNQPDSFSTEHCQYLNGKACNYQGRTITAPQFFTRIINYIQGRKEDQNACCVCGKPSRYNDSNGKSFCSVDCGGKGYA